MSKADECHCKYCDMRRAAQTWPPAPSGDEAKVREIAEKHMAGYGSVPVNYVERAAREAYAAGKADESERILRNVAAILGQGVSDSVKLGQIAQAIARRGSEGK